MVRQTAYARAQLDALLVAYLTKGRYRAYEKLLDAIEQAAAAIAANPTGGLMHPSPYPGLGRWRLRWIKKHRYWFAWSMRRGDPVVTNVFFEASAMWRRGRVKPDAGDLMPF